jgi:hypothetical protein
LLGSNGGASFGGASDPFRGGMKKGIGATGELGDVCCGEDGSGLSLSNRTAEPTSRPGEGEVCGWKYAVLEDLEGVETGPCRSGVCTVEDVFVDCSVNVACELFEEEIALPNGLPNVPLLPILGAVALGLKKAGFLMFSCFS